MLDGGVRCLAVGNKLLGSRTPSELLLKCFLPSGGCGFSSFNVRAFGRHGLNISNY